MDASRIVASDFLGELQAGSLCSLNSRKWLSIRCRVAGEIEEGVLVSQHAARPGVTAEHWRVDLHSGTGLLVANLLLLYGTLHWSS